MKKEKQQIDEMINEGLAGGKIDDKLDKKQLENPISKKAPGKNDNKEVDNTMVADIKDAKKLGDDMEKMKTNKEVKAEGKTPSPEQ